MASKVRDSLTYRNSRNPAPTSIAVHRTEPIASRGRLSDGEDNAKIKIGTRVIGGERSSAIGSARRGQKGASGDLIERIGRHQGACYRVYGSADPFVRSKSIIAR